MASNRKKHDERWADARCGTRLRRASMLGLQHAVCRGDTVAQRSSSWPPAPGLRTTALALTRDGARITSWTIQERHDRRVSRRCLACCACAFPRDCRDERGADCGGSCRQSMCVCPATWASADETMKRVRADRAVKAGCVLQKNCNWGLEAEQFLLRIFLLYFALDKLTG